jgi:hypothetical protein
VSPRLCQHHLDLVEKKRQPVIVADGQGGVFTRPAQEII